MIDGFVVTYKDSENFIHLYFYPGIDKEGKPIYRDIDLSDCRFRHTKKKYIDNAVDYKFFDKRIYKLNCRLLDFNNNEHIEILTV